MVRVLAGGDAFGKALSELGGLGADGGDGGTCVVQGALRLYEAKGEIAADYAGGIAGDFAGYQRLRYHCIPEHGAAASGPLRGDPLVRLGERTSRPFNVFTIGVAVAGFVGLWLLLQKTSFGRAVRAIGDDEEVSKVVGINTTVIIAAVFFIGAAFAAMAGILSGHDTSIQPRMGLLLLLKGWVASVVGGIGNLYGAIVGGFALGMIEQFGIWTWLGSGRTRFPLWC